MIELKNVTKNYGKTVAIHDLSMKIERSGIYCLLGRNGAGKTTLLKSLSGHISCNSGSIIINGKGVSQIAMPEDVHFVESNAVQFNMKLDDLFKAAANLNSTFDYAHALEISDKFKLDRKKRYKHLSFGMKAMVNTLLALSSGREILLLDEPVLGFDPVMRKNFYNMLQESNAMQNKTIIISTHIIDEIAKVAEQLIIIDKGQLVQLSDMNEIDDKAYSILGVEENVRAATKGLNILNETKVGGFLSQNIYDNRLPESNNYSISALSLQDFFIALVGDEEGSNENRN